MLNPKLLILAAALLGAGCMTNDNGADLIGTGAIAVPATEIAGFAGFSSRSHKE